MTIEIEPVSNHFPTKLEFTREQIDLMKATVCKGASDDEFKLFLYQCRRTGLDPFARQIYSIQRKTWNPQTNAYDMNMTTQTSIDGFRLVAQRSGKYQGQLGPFWCGEDGIWKDSWIEKNYPAAARVGVLRSDFKEPLWAVARWGSYVQTHKDKTTKADIVSKMWAKMPDLMLAKVAEALALRKAFPQELSGLYSSEEFSHPEESAHEVKASEPQEHNREPVPAQQTQKTKAIIAHPSEAQLKRLYTIASAQGYSNEDMKSSMLKAYGIESSKELSLKQYDEIVHWLETHPRPKTTEAGV